MAERPPYRLAHTVAPKHYQLEIEPDLPNSRFKGRAVIEVEVRERLQEMVLNAVDLTLEHVSIKDAGGQELIGTVSYNTEEEQVDIAWPGELAPGMWELTIEYQGVLGSDMRGFYRTAVEGKDGSTVLIAATQCEQTDARRVFPGWDEPEFKASFSIALVVEPHEAAFSNARELSNVLDERGKRRVTFARTIPMSTYLVALVVGPYETTEPVMVGEVPVRIAARPGFSHLTDFAETAAVDTLKYFQQYFGISYPGDKLDHVAIPEFAAGAMENLGCVTYREELLLIDPEKSSPIERSNVAEVIAHETAHMWFGDLVTMRWWNGIWLNEAFATFMELLAVDALHPEWDPWTIFSHGRSMAMAVDSLESTRPVEFPVNRPVEAWAMFDLLTYQKGGSVLRMLEQFLGPETFRKSIVHYLQRNRYANTETSDLWDALESTSHQPVRSMMESWVLQPGYPLVQAKLSADGQRVTLTQKQFRYGKPGDGAWQVPITVGIGLADGGEKTVRGILGDTPMDVPMPDNMAWVIVNRGGWGFYRTAYDEKLAHRLSDALPKMTAIERYQLLDDVWAAVQAGDAPLPRAVQLWRGMTEERDPDVWGAVTPNLTLLESIADDGERMILAKLARDMAGPLFAQLGWNPKPGEDVRVARVRGALLRLLGTLGADDAVREEAGKRWRGFLGGTEQLAPELLTPVVNVVAHGGTAEDWDTMYAEYKNAKTPQDEQRYLFGLAGFTDPDLIRRTLDLYLSTELRLQNGPIALGRLLGNRHASAMTWEAIEAHWSELQERFPVRAFEYFAMPVAFFVDEELAARARAWFESHPIEVIERAVAQALEFQKVNAALAHRLRGRLAEMLG